MVASPTNRIQLTASMLPSGASESFRDSGYYAQHNELPTPEEVLKAAAEEDHLQPTSAPRRDGTVRFPSLKLFVKFGNNISAAEGQCLWALRRYMKEGVNVPEVYGWRKEGNNTFIYMELLEGDTLEDKWGGLNDREKEGICEQLRGMVSSWQSFEQEPGDVFVGRIDRQPLLDYLFEGRTSPENPAGPFRSISAFHDWFIHVGRPAASRNMSPHPYRADLADDVPVVFTHGDLHPSNIIISPEWDSERGKKKHRVTVIDWHQSGWYPEPWESCKAGYSVPANGEWSTRYLLKVVGPSLEGYHTAWEWFSLSLV